jgi:hypothetical protein
MATPKYNNVGRPLKFKSAKELESLIEEYFDYCDNRIKTFYKDGQDITASVPAPYTMSGLARRLKIDRKTLVNYSHKDEYFLTIKDARERVQEDIETRLMETHNQTGAIFNLKNNFGWQDKREEDITSGGKPIVSHPLLGEAKTYVPTNDSNQEDI